MHPIFHNSFFTFMLINSNALKFKISKKNFLQLERKIFKNYSLYFKISIIF